MNKKIAFRFVAFVLITSFLTISALAQGESKIIKQTKFKSDTLDFGSGGTISVIGAPEGSIQIEGWNKNKVEISAEIVVEAKNEEDLRRLANVCGFVLDESILHLRIITVGTQDKKYLKKVDKKFPKHLRNAPYQVNYKLKVPFYSDLEIDGGRGDLDLSAVEGTINIKYLEATNAKLNLVGGTVQATIGTGDVDVTLATRSWRGRFAEVQLSRGNLNVWLPNNLNANLNAKVLRNGKIENSYELLKPINRTQFTENQMLARAGNGGAQLNFTVGDGMLKIADFEKPAK